MRAAIVTGASSGIGFEISKVLIKLGYKVYGIGKDFSKINFNEQSFIEMNCDITKTSILCEKIKYIRDKEDVYIVVNNAGAGYFGPHEELNPNKIHEMVSVNLEAPMIITQLMLRNLKKNSGFIINISSIEAKKSSTYGCVYGATKAGLTDFSNSLFDETRKYGVKVITIHPDMTKTNFYRNSNFKEGESAESHITAEEVANVVKSIVTQREGLVITDVTIRPQKHFIRKKFK
ncbi:SDR family oxidoreductase [Clostridium sp. P21]|uniref:SDR family oxidoreductase n=1 Tax=Clostridium muellerianum TaxID=2716538 RepID=A0A7Y0EI13_9CLOT|nr:SDR family oxidoreductase [Clostridium muellerianum]NMM62785.1 SDR family oxidoreductase [Clostridium muellerianum]